MKIGELCFPNAETELPDQLHHQFQLHSTVLNSLKPRKKILMRFFYNSIFFLCHPLQVIGINFPAYGKMGENCFTKPPLYLCETSGGGNEKDFHFHHQFQLHSTVLNFLKPRKKILIKFFYKSIFFLCHPSHRHPLQVENCDSNSRLVVDEDDDGKFRPKMVNWSNNSIWKVCKNKKYFLSFEAGS